MTALAAAALGLVAALDRQRQLTLAGRSNRVDLWALTEAQRAYDRARGVR
jgi:hypothetical protein